MADADDRLTYRMFLHAASLSLPVPELGGPLNMQSPLSPVGWAGAFEPDEQMRAPEGFVGTASLVEGLKVDQG